MQYKKHFLLLLFLLKAIIILLKILELSSNIFTFLAILGFNSIIVSYSKESIITASYRPKYTFNSNELLFINSIFFVILFGLIFVFSK